jgi:hypothetical protein
MADCTTPKTCWPSKREAFDLGFTLGRLHTMAEMKQPPPKSGEWTMTWSGIGNSVKNLIGYFTAAHKVVLLWRAVSVTYIGRGLLRWLGWL